MLAAVSCSAAAEPHLDDEAAGGGKTGQEQLDGFEPGSGGGAASDCVIGGASEDRDKDGFTPAQGDCNDCDPSVNPGAIEVPTAQGGHPADENCDGQTDEALPGCDGGLALESGAALQGARAADVCFQRDVAGKRYGLIDARYVRADGSMFSPGPQVGILPGFGDNVTPRNGERLLALSTGRARLPGHIDACLAITCEASGLGKAPAGFPQDVPNCAGSKEINDDIALQIDLRAPTNATGYSFAFSFYTHEYPEFVCSSYNDQFIALVGPPPAGSMNGNICFDGNSNPVSVNIAFFEVCEGCQDGTAPLIGTGFDTLGNGIGDAGATGWLETKAPVKGGELLSIRFAIWDTGDNALDSTVLIDDFKWLATTGTSVEVGTKPVPK